MAEKDVTEKLLADYNDVFADIVHVLLFDGKQIVAADDLETVKDRSQYKADGRIHEQERDVSKLLKSGKTTITLFGLNTRQQPRNSCRCGRLAMMDNHTVRSSCMRIRTTFIR